MSIGPIQGIARGPAPIAGPEPAEVAGAAEHDSDGDENAAAPAGSPTAAKPPVPGQLDVKA